MTPCELMIRSRWCLPIAPSATPIEQGAVAIDGGRILAIGPGPALAARLRPQTLVELGNHVVLPGLVNAHGHAAMALLRGAAEDLALQDWLNKAIWPLEGRVVNAEMVRVGTELAIAEMLGNGITCFADHYFFPEQAAACVTRTGMRAQIAFPITDFPNPWAQKPEDAFHKGLELHDAYRDHPRVHIAFGPHAAYSLGAKNLERTLMYSEELGRPVQIHLHENAAEVEEAKRRVGHSWIRHLDEIGLMSPSLQAVHLTQVTDAEVELLAECGVQAIHCPCSNLKLASGICPLPRLAQAGVNLALGTDSAASNNTLDLFTEARLAALLAKHISGDATAGAAADVLRMATLGGAEALGLGKDIGSLEPGKQADLIAVDLSGPAFTPVRDPASALIHGPAGAAVSDVWVAGRRLYANGEHQTLALDAVCAKANLQTELMQ